jgi:hypothetical protein
MLTAGQNPGGQEGKGGGGVSRLARRASDERPCPPATCRPGRWTGRCGLCGCTTGPSWNQKDGGVASIRSPTGSR